MERWGLLSAQWWHAECVSVPEIILDAVMSQAAWDGSIPHIGLIHQIFDFQDEPTIFWYINQSIPMCGVLFRSTCAQSNCGETSIDLPNIF